MNPTTPLSVCNSNLSYSHRALHLSRTNVALPRFEEYLPEISNISSCCRQSSGGPKNCALSQTTTGCGEIVVPIANSVCGSQTPRQLLVICIQFPDHFLWTNH